MSVGRRRVVLPLAFLALALALTGTRAARAQQFGAEQPHRLWNTNLTPQQIKEALDKLGLGGEDEKDQFKKMLRDHVMKQHPEFPKELVDLAIQKALSDPSFLEKAKQMAKEKQTDPGRAPKLTQEDIAKFAKIVPNNDPTQPPKIDGPPDAGKVPNGRPPVGVPPVAPPKTPGKQDPPPPQKVDPGNPVTPPKDDPGNTDANPRPTRPNSMVPPPGGQQPPPPPQSKAEELFRPPDEPTDPRSKSLQAFAAVWERNVGPLDQTPEVKRALFDLVSDTNGFDFDLKDDKGNSLWDLLRKGENDGLSFGDFMDGADGGNWKLPQFDLPSFKMGKWFGGSSPNTSSSSSSGSSWKLGSSSSSPRTPRGGSSGGGSGGLGNFSFGGSYFPLVILGLVALGILLWVLVKHLREGEPAPAYATDGLGPWPIDPRQINTREDVVKAFEYLSVLICGPSAKTWTHGTIADALSELATTHGETAVMLARLYELARYAPLDEPLTRAEVMEARELVCGLAGVSY